MAALSKDKAPPEPKVLTTVIEEKTNEGRGSTQKSGQTGGSLSYELLEGEGDRQGGSQAENSGLKASQVAAQRDLEGWTV